MLGSDAVARSAAIAPVAQDRAAPSTRAASTLTTPERAEVAGQRHPRAPSPSTQVETSRRRDTVLKLPIDTSSITFMVAAPTGAGREAAEEWTRPALHPHERSDPP